MSISANSLAAALTRTMLIVGVALASQASMAAGFRGGALATSGCCSISTLSSQSLNGDSFNVTNVSSESATHSFQQVIEDANKNPLLGLLSSATVTVQYGRISAYASAEAKGFSQPGVSGVSAAAGAIVFDSFTVDSATLPVGTLVDIDFDLAVVGSGGFVSSYFIKQIGKATGGPVSGPPKELKLQLSGNFNGIGGQQRGSIQALIGELYTVEYELRAFAQVTDTNLTGGTKSSVSDYAHTGHFYAQASSPAVVLRTASGFDYSQPAAVPVPGGAWLLMAPAVLLIRRRAAA